MTSLGSSKRVTDANSTMNVQNAYLVSSIESSIEWINKKRRDVEKDLQDEATNIKYFIATCQSLIDNFKVACDRLGMKIGALKNNVCDYYVIKE